MEQLPKKAQLKIQLYKNTLTAKLDEFFGKVMLSGFVTIDDIAEMIETSGSPFTREQIRVISALVAKAAFTCVANGFSVKLDTCTMRAAIGGIFKGKKSIFDPQQNTLSISYTASALARQSLKDVSVLVSGPALSGMVINRVFDVTSGEENSRLTPGRILKVYGVRLTIEGNLPDVGIWFTNTVDPSKRIRLADDCLANNAPSKLTILVPYLDKGEWFLELVSQSTTQKGRLLKKSRTCIFEMPLTVV